MNLKCCIKAREPFKTPFNGVLFPIYYFKKHFRPCFFILKALKDILKHFEFVNWRIILYYSPNFVCIVRSKYRFHWFFIGSSTENFYNFVKVRILYVLLSCCFHIFKGKQNTELDFMCFVRSAHFFFALKWVEKGLTNTNVLSSTALKK